MATETSAVLVAVRVRPFNTRESPLECTVTVPDSRSITLTDVSSSVSGGGQRHVFTFDKIFWSIPANVLPLCMSSVSPPTCSPRFVSMDSIATTIASRAASIIPGMGTGSSSGSSTAGVTDTFTAATRLQTSHLPCLAQVPEYDDQSSVYNFIGPRMYESAMAGYNSCLFAYGQTGSGKTHSMIGPPEGFASSSAERGILPRLCQDLFDMMRREREEDESVSFNVECGFLEIYCERVRDLLLHTSSKEATSGGSFLNTSSGNPLTSTTNNGSTNIVVGGGGGGGGGSCMSYTAGSSLRIRQHPTRGPFVEGLSLVKVRDATGAMRLLLAGLRDRATAETRMNEHSSRSHALLQLHITRISVVETAGVVVPKTRVCKVSLVDLAGSERVSQSGATGDRFEEARNINLSLTTLGRVMLQLTDKQAGRNVVPAYRDSVLTWLLADSLGGNSKTIMLATVAPSVGCYQQTLNTLRFAGVAKKVINVASINEDKQFQKLIASLRQQIVKLTLQVEEGKASEVHHEEICALRRERDELEQELSIMRASMLTMVPGTEMVALQRRVSDLEEANAQLHKEKNQLQRQLISTTTALREELAQKRGEVMRLNEILVSRDSELQEWRRRYREETVRRETSPPQVQHYHQQQQEQQGTSSLGWPPKSLVSNTMISTSPPPPPLVVVAEPSRRRDDLERRVEKLASELREEQCKREEVDKARNTLRKQMETIQQEHADTLRQLEDMQNRLVEKTNALDVAQSDLAATRTLLRVERGENTTAERERELATQLEKARADYLNEKQTNVNLLLSLSKMARQVSDFKKEVAVKSCDVIELEQLLLEETEASERYYMRLRYFRDLLGITIPFLRGSPVIKGTRGASIALLSGSSSNNISRDKPVIGENFLWEQLLRDCTRDEAYSRALLEEEHLNTVLELVRQWGLLYQLSFAVANEELMELRAAADVSSEELQRLRRKVETIEAVYEKEIAERHKLQTVLSNSESARERLSRRVDDLTDELEHLQKSNETLIQKIVDVQASRDAFNVTSAETTPSNPDLGEEGMEEPIQQQRQRQLAHQVVKYQEEIGLLHAQLEKERSDRIERARSVQREKGELMSELRRVQEDRNATLKESTQIVKDYEARVNELEEVVATLRTALDEECNNADKAQDQMRRAQIARSEAVTELNSMRRSMEILQSNRDISESRYAELSQQLHQLQTAYVELERRVMEVKLHDADVYLTIERDGDDRSWMEKAQREKEVLERQKRDVRRLNEELLEMVRQRNESLRAVHRQITKLQRGGVSPEMDEFSVPDVTTDATMLPTATTAANATFTAPGKAQGDSPEEPQPRRMFHLQSVLLMALDVVKGPYLHCCAPVNPFDAPSLAHTTEKTNINSGYSNKMDVGVSSSSHNSRDGAPPPHESTVSDRLSGFSDVFVPRSEFCHRVMYLFEAESGMFYLFYPEEIAGAHYQRQTLRYSLCFVFAVDKSLVTSTAMLTERLVRPYSVVLTSIVGELREAEELYGYMSRGLSRPCAFSSFSHSSFRPTKPEMEPLNDTTSGGCTRREEHLPGGSSSSSIDVNSCTASPAITPLGNGSIGSTPAVSTVFAQFTTSDDFSSSSAKGRIHVNAFLAPMQDPVALHCTPLEQMVETLYARLASNGEALRGDTPCTKDNGHGIPHKEEGPSSQHEEEKLSLEERIVSRRLAEMHSFCVCRMVQPQPSPRYTLDEVPIPIAEYSPELFEWADLAVRDVFKAVDGQRTIGSIVQILATGYEAVEEEVHKQNRFLSPRCNPQTITSPFLFPRTPPSVRTKPTAAVGGGLGLSAVVTECDITQSPSMKYENPFRTSTPAVPSGTQGNETRIVSPLSLGSRSHSGAVFANATTTTTIVASSNNTTTTTTTTTGNNNNNYYYYYSTGVTQLKGHNPLQTSSDRPAEETRITSHEGPTQPLWGELERIVLEALQHLEVNNYVRIIHPCRLQSIYTTTNVLYRVMCDRSHSARRILGHRMCLIEKRVWKLLGEQIPEVTKQRQRRKDQHDSMYDKNKEFVRSKNGLCHVHLPLALLNGTSQGHDQRDTLNEEGHGSSLPTDTGPSLLSGGEQVLYSPPSLITSPSLPPYPAITIAITRDDDVSDGGGRSQENGWLTSVITEVEAETAAAAALCALGKFTNSTVSTVQREMRSNPIWCNAFLGWQDECCRSLVEIALINGWLKETAGAGHTKSQESLS